MKEGRWVRLERYTEERPKRKRVRRGRLHEATRFGWAVMLRATPLVGEKVAVVKANGTRRERWVRAIIKRWENGQALVVVSENPIRAVEPVQGTSEVRRTLRPEATPQNPRICEECEGPCRPGAGRCDGCKNHTNAGGKHRASPP